MTTIPSPAEPILPIEPLPRPLPAIGWEPSDWSKALHDRRVKQGMLRDSANAFADRVRTELINASGGCDDSTVDSDEQVNQLGNEINHALRAITRASFARLYNDPLPAETALPSWAQAISDNLQPGIDEIRHLLHGDADMSAIALAALLRDTADSVSLAAAAAVTADYEQRTAVAEEPEVSEGEEAPPDTEGEPIEVEPTEAQVAAGQAAATAAAVGRSAARKALSEALKARAALNGIAPGLGTATAVGADDDQRFKLSQSLSKDQAMQQLIKLSGRMVPLADKVRMSPSRHSHESIVDVTRGGDVTRALPTELSKLRHPKLRTLQRAAMLDKKLLSWEFEGQEPLGKGEVVVLLDISTSMEDDTVGKTDGIYNMRWGCAAAHSVIRGAFAENRKATLAPFNKRVAEGWVKRVERQDTGAMVRATKLLATMRSEGGTEYDGPIAWALDNGAERDRADLVMITDGYAECGAAVAQRLLEAQKRGVRLWVLVIGAGVLDPAFRKLCTGVYRLVSGGNIVPE